MNLTEYASFDGLGLAELVKNRKVSKTELAQCSFDAIKALNGELNAVIETYDEAIKKIDDDKVDSNQTFPGVPFLFKDIGAHDGNVVNELGSRIAKGLRSPPAPSEHITRFHSTGISVLGRTNIPELGSSCTTEPILYGPTHNPWDVTRSPGGSSGGAAAAVISGMVPMAHANDAGGSIRWPASACGLFGLKPSRNLNPVGPDQATPVNGFAAEHIVSKTVRDSAAMLDATAGPDVGAWCYTPRLNGSYLEDSKKPVGKLRIALNLTTNFPPVELASTVVDATREVAKLCETLGHEVEEASLDFDAEALLRANYIMWASGIRRGILDLAHITGRTPSLDTIEPSNMAAFHAAETMKADELQWAMNQLNMISRAYGNFFERYDVILSPTGSAEPFKLGYLQTIPTEPFFDWYMNMMKTCPFTSSVNMAGLPAMSIPLVQSPTGMPIGSHFIAGLGQEPTLFRLAIQLEAAKPWIGRRPPVHVANL